MNFNIKSKDFLFAVLLFCYAFNLYAQSDGAAIYSIFDGQRRIYYSDVADAETKILEYYEERLKNNPVVYFSALPYAMFTELILQDPRAFYYDFKRFKEASSCDMGTVRSLEIVESPDRRLRLYTWDDNGGTMTNYSGITSIAQGGSVFSYSTYRNEETGMNYTDNFPNVASGAYAIEQFTDATGETIYAVYQHSSGSNMMQHLYVSMYKIRNHFIERAPVFETEYGMDSRIGVYFAPYGRYYLELECNNGEFLLPETRENDYILGHGNLFTGRCVSYKWNGTYFSNNGFVYPLDDDLYAPIRNYQFYVGQFDFDKWIVRVDKMPNGAFRYVSWKKPKTPRDVPDLIINKGTEEIVEDTSIIRYVFQNNEYFYALLCDFYQSYAVLVVMRNDKVLMTLKSVDVIDCL